jgi:hypothetical protein
MHHSAESDIHGQLKIPKALIHPGVLTIRICTTRIGYIMNKSTWSARGSWLSRLNMAVVHHTCAMRLNIV